MATRLTAGALNGVNHTEVFEFDYAGERLEVEIRPLSNKESGDIEGLLQQGITMRGRPGGGGKVQQSMDFDMQRSAQGRAQGNLKACALGTVDPSLTEQVIEQEWPAAVVRQVGNRVRILSGLSSDDDEDDSGPEQRVSDMVEGAAFRRDGGAGQ